MKFLLCASSQSFSYQDGVGIRLRCGCGGSVMLGITLNNPQQISEGSTVGAEREGTDPNAARKIFWAPSTCSSTRTQKRASQTKTNEGTLRVPWNGRVTCVHPPMLLCLFGLCILNPFMPLWYMHTHRRDPLQPWNVST